MGYSDWRDDRSVHGLQLEISAKPAPRPVELKRVAERGKMKSDIGELKKRRENRDAIVAGASRAMDAAPGPKPLSAAMQALVAIDVRGFVTPEFDGGELLNKRLRKFALDASQHVLIWNDREQDWDDGILRGTVDSRDVHKAEIPDGHSASEYVHLTIRSFVEELGKDDRIVRVPGDRLQAAADVGFKDAQAIGHEFF